MSGRTASSLKRPGLGALGAVLAIAVASGCSGGGLTVQPGPTDPPVVYPTDTPYNGPASGTWTGTITFTGSIAYDKEEPGHSDLDPSNTYYEEWVTTDAVHLDATDTFSVTADDPDDLSYGIRSLALEGSVANAGTTQQRHVTLTDKQNSGCTWKQEDGDETAGSWSANDEAGGELNFSNDGSYSMRIYPESGSYPVVPHRHWLKYSDISADCEVNYPEQDDTDDGAPSVSWVSSYMNRSDVHGMDVAIRGQIDASNPGSTVDGSSTWEMDSPEGLTITIAWHLVHSTPIVLPHS